MGASRAGDTLEELPDQCSHLGGPDVDGPRGRPNDYSPRTALIAQCVPCSCELQLRRCNINSICQVVGADKNTNDCHKRAPRRLYVSFFFSLLCAAEE